MVPFAAAVAHDPDQDGSIDTVTSEGRWLRVVALAVVNFGSQMNGKSWCRSGRHATTIKAVEVYSRLVAGRHGDVYVSTISSRSSVQFLVGVKTFS